MPELDLADLDSRMRQAIKEFWQALGKAKGASADQSNERAAVLSGGHLNSVAKLISDLVVASGLPSESVKVGDRVDLPGYFRATKKWDLLIVHEGKLLAAIELKSMGSSFGNNLNNRAEEVLGLSLDFFHAHKHDLFGSVEPPFLGYCVIVVDDPIIHRPVSTKASHFAVLPEFQDRGYAERWVILCKKMIQERIYNAAAVILTNKDDGLSDGRHHSLDEVTSFRHFIRALMAHLSVATGS